MEKEYKDCEICHWRLPLNYPSNICPKCEDIKLFSDVRDYIRNNEVNEYMVADKFDIPISKVRKWIKEGRIEYVELGKRIVGTTCQRCGKAVSFGTLCSSCKRLMNMNDKKLVFAAADPKEEARMRFLDEK